MGQIGEDQPDGDYPQGVPQTQRKTPGKRDKEQADVTVMDTQAESKCADGAGIARRLQVEAEPAEHRERFERDGEDQAVWPHNASGLSCTCLAGNEKEQQGEALLLLVVESQRLAALATGLETTYHSPHASQ